MKRTFIYADEKSNKFWTIEINGNGFTVNYGKTGTAGQTQTKSFADEAACQKEAEKLIKEKTKKGYVEQPANDEGGSAAHEPVHTCESAIAVEIMMAKMIGDCGLSGDEARVINLFGLNGSILQFEFRPGLVTLREKNAKGYPMECVIHYDLDKVTASTEAGKTVSFTFPDEFKQWVTRFLKDNDFYKWVVPQAAKPAVAKKPKAPKAPKAADTFGGFKVPKYKGHDEADVDSNEYVVNIKKPASIASALKHQMSHYNDFFYNLQSMPAQEALTYGIIDDDEYIPLAEAYEDDDMGDYDEEVLATAASEFPEIFPFLEEYANKVIIRASRDEQMTGPWTTEGTLFGQFIIPMLAEADKKYFYLLEDFMKANIEIKIDDEFKELFAEKRRQIAAKWGIKLTGELNDPSFELPSSYEVKIDIPAYTPPQGLKKYEFVVDLTNPLSIASVIKYHLDNFSDYVQNIKENLRYGTMENGQFQYIQTDPFKKRTRHQVSERIFYTAAVSFPELRPLVANFVLRAIAECANYKSTGPWVNMEFLLGEFAIEELVDADPSYLRLLIEYMRSHIEVRYSNVFNEQFRRTLTNTIKQQQS